MSPSGPAEAAGINVGDLILQVDGKPVSSPDDLLDHLTGRSVGETVAVSTLRGGLAREVSITIAERH